MPVEPARPGPSSAERREHVRSYAAMALVDGEMSDEETQFIRRLGEQVGLSRREVDSIVAQESRKHQKTTRQPKAPSAPPAAALAPSSRSATGVLTRAPAKRSLSELLSILEEHGTSARQRFASTAAAAAPVAAVAGAAAMFAPVLVPLLLILAVMPSLATWGEAVSRRESGENAVRITAAMTLRLPQNVLQALQYSIPPLLVAGPALAALVFFTSGELWLRAAGSAASAAIPLYFMWIARSGSGDRFLIGTRSARAALLQWSRSPVRWFLVRGHLAAAAGLLAAAAVHRIPAVWWPLQLP